MTTLNAGRTVDALISLILPLRVGGCILKRCPCENRAPAARWVAEPCDCVFYAVACIDFRATLSLRSDVVLFTGTTRHGPSTIPPQDCRGFRVSFILSLSNILDRIISSHYTDAWTLTSAMSPITMRLEGLGG
jgi:hypothetical protein